MMAFPPPREPLPNPQELVAHWGSQANWPPPSTRRCSSKLERKKKKKKVKINKQKLYKSICLLLFISFVVFKVFPPCLKALGHCVTIPVSKVLFMIFRVFLLSTLGANHVIQGLLTTAACLWFLGSPCFIFLLWVWWLRLRLMVLSLYFGL